MTGFRRVQELFLRARDLEAEERAEYLAAECGDDGALRAEVLSMLGFEQASPDFLEQPAVPASTIMDALQREETSAGRVRKLAGQSNTARRFVAAGELAEGGMGRILEVFDTDLRRSVAMKVLRDRPEGTPAGQTPGVDSPLLARFLEEAQVTGQLEHPGVVPVYELGVDSDGQVYFTMRKVRGHDLGAIIERVTSGAPGWSLVRALGILQRVCETMAFAHGKGVVHRDLKPANVMVGDYGEVYVMDWGLARLRGRDDARDLTPATRDASSAPAAPIVTDRTSSDSDMGSALMTMDGTVIGTPHFMPPEQAQGHIEQIDERSDVYALGAMLYHLLAGHMPYARPGQPRGAHDVLGEVLEGPPRPLHRVARDAPPELVAICERAMARDRAQRYPGMGALGADLTAFLEGRVVAAHRTGAATQLVKWVKRNRALSTALASFVLAVAGGLAASLATLAEARQESYRATIAGVSQAMEVENQGRARLLLDQAPEALRGWEWDYFRRRLEFQVPTELYTTPVPLGGLADGVHGFVRDSGELFLTQLDRVWLWNRPGNEARELRLEAGQNESWLRLAVAASPEGRFLLGFEQPYSEESPTPRRLARAMVWETRSGAHVGTLPSLGRDWNDATSLSADGRFACITGESNALFEVSTGASWALGYGLAEFSPDGRWLYHRVGGRIRGLDLITGRVAWSAPGPGFAHGASVLREPALLAGVYQSYGQPGVLDLASGLPRHTLEAPTGATELLGLSPDGSKLAAETSSAIHLWDLETGRPWLTLHDRDSHVRISRRPYTATQWDRDRLATPVQGPQGTGIRVWDTGASIATWREHSDYVYELAVHPEGGLLASGTFRGRLMLWDAKSGRPLARHLPSQAGRQVKALAFDPARERLVASDSADLLVYHTGTDELLHQTLRGYHALAFSADGSRLYAGGKSFDVLDGETLEVLSSLPLPESERDGPSDKVMRLVLDPSGRRAAIAIGAHPRNLGANTVAIIDLERLAFLSILEGTMHSLAWSPDGQRLAASTWGGHARIWAVDDEGGLEQIASHPAHAGRAYTLRWLTSRRLVTGGEDGELRILDAEDGQELATLRGHDSYVFDLVVSPDGKTIYSCGGDMTVRVWDTGPTAERIAAYSAWQPLRDEAEELVDRLAANGGSVDEIPDPDLRRMARFVAPTRAAPSTPSDGGRPDLAGADPDPQLPDQETGARPTNKVLSLDGRGTVELNWGLIDLQTFTLECWARGPEPDRDMTIMAGLSSGGPALVWSGVSPDAPLATVVHPRARSLLPTGKPRPWDDWVHLALTVGDGSEALFVDGKLAHRTEMSGPVHNSPPPFVVGGWAADRPARFVGSIDEVRVSRVVRYHEDFTPAPVHERDEHTLVLLHFDAEVDGHHPDDSGHAHHGRTVGEVQVVAEER